jgi:hypothetical protein
MSLQQGKLILKPYKIKDFMVTLLSRLLCISFFHELFFVRLWNLSNNYTVEVSIVVLISVFFTIIDYREEMKLKRKSFFDEIYYFQDYILCKKNNQDFKIKYQFIDFVTQDRIKKTIKDYFKKRYLVSINFKVISKADKEDYLAVGDIDLFVLDMITLNGLKYMYEISDELTKEEKENLVNLINNNLNTIS